MNVQTLLDLEAIKNLRIRYSHLLDSNRIAELAELFAPDAVCNAGLGEWRGRNAIRAGLQRAFDDYDTERHGSYPFLHAVTNHWVELLDADTAQGRCYLIDLHTRQPEQRDPWILLGAYADEYRRIDGRWQISRSQLDIVWPARNGGGGQPGDDLELPAREAA
ncbi:nuclear transport factor 2 family protein [Janthinobacterium sp. P210006]|uniref:nuclear transport factor 2 family protein n=1 Tax=Janthinobacterium sp. P210006 TaxID=3112939 RepID=UPI002E26902B|nr:nuclear transport factor 2 family protein [Janthinobacterium sp. P210006]